jgi:hypothetical protein
MKAPYEYNPYIETWNNLDNNQLLFHWLSKWYNFIQLPIANGLKSVEDEKCLDKLWISLKQGQK